MLCIASALSLSCSASKAIGSEGQPCDDDGGCLDDLDCCADDVCRKDCSLDGDTTSDGDESTDGDNGADGDNGGGEDSCIDNDHYSCDSGDVYWFDSCGNRLSKKSECDDCACSDNVCIFEAQYSIACSNDNVYWYDCHGERGDKSQECGDCGCSNDECVIIEHYSSSCYNDDVYWFDCNGRVADKKKECGTGGCCIGEIACMDLEFQCCDGVCTDPETGFEWQQEPTGGTMIWNDAITHCQNLDLDGGGWRLPNISELRSLVRGCGPIETGGACGVKGVCTPCGDAAACLADSCSADCNPSSCADNGGPTGCYWPQQLSGTCSRFWSSSANVYLAYYAWYVSFNYGFVDGYNKGGNYDARCVREGP